MNQLTEVFNYEGNNVRTVIKDGEIWFVGNDVTEILKYTNSRDAIYKHIDEEDKGVAKCDTPGGKQNMTIINESGLYSLIFSSKMKEAKNFKRWVTHEVLPQIRKTGQYNPYEDKLPATFSEALRQLAVAVEEKEQLQLTTKKQKQVIGELKPKADYTDRILKNKGLVTITQIAKDYGMSGRAMNDLLHELGIQYKQSGQWLLYADYQDRGYTQSETIDIERKDGTPDIVMNTKWTQKGRLFLYNLLKEENILPVIEKEQIWE